MTTAFMTSLKSAPNRRPIATVRSQLFGRTKPIADHGVSEAWAQASTSSALSGKNRKLPARITRIAARPSGPKPRSCRASRSSVDASDDVTDRLNDELRLVELNLVVAFGRDDQLAHSRQGDEICLALVQNVSGSPAAPQHYQWKIAKGMWRRETPLAQRDELLAPGIRRNPGVRHVYA